MTSAAQWDLRFRATRIGLPRWAADAPQRNLFPGTAHGSLQFYAWDRCTGVQRQVTNVPQGTLAASIDPAGEWIWWFADQAGSEVGGWLREPFDGGPAERPWPHLAPALPAGLALGPGGLAVLGRATPNGTTILAGQPPSRPWTVYEADTFAEVAGLSADARLIAITHDEHGDFRHPALRVFRTTDGCTVSDLWDGPDSALHVQGFAPRAGDQRLLLLAERGDRQAAVIWDPLGGRQSQIALDLPGQITACWYPDASALLVSHHYRARGELYRYDLAARALTRLKVPRGTIRAASVRPDGSVEYEWSSAASPWTIRSSTGEVVLSAPGTPAPGSVPVQDADIPGPGGRIHALLSVPPAGSPPYPAVFELHGGPHESDDDSFNPTVAAWVDAGFAVVQVNYRGSAGYGAAWRDAIMGRVGLTELDDVAAVRAWLVQRGFADPARLILSGRSWGGYLALLGIGTQRDLWQAGIASSPIADYAAAYAEEIEPLRAFDRSLFGGSPSDAPERYRLSSPLTYVASVRAPLLILAGANDQRCPATQIENYLRELRSHGKHFEIYRYDAGHGSLVIAERIRQMAVKLDFAGKYARKPQIPLPG